MTTDALRDWAWRQIAPHFHDAIDDLKAKDLAAFDSLPPRLRTALREALGNYDANQWLGQFKKIAFHVGPMLAQQKLLLHLAANEGLLMQQFMADYYKKMGRPLPHAAAKATLQGYGSTIPKGRRPLRRYRAGSSDIY